ncbi:hypothetical protein DPMN_067750 [Dreissena polymorpha]|uniref:Uncharacterized protein n=1 Tax=Dreissena polymorpha TaxID=45954 RepID=A0A9D4BW25_DREPO|nr:hypothetical protein DPMN_067750 [Dreissena polymorpha]
MATSSNGQTEQVVGKQFHQLRHHLQALQILLSLNPILQLRDLDPSSSHKMQDTGILTIMPPKTASHLLLVH